MNARAAKRLENELKKFNRDAAAAGITIKVHSPTEWHVAFDGAIGTLYEGESYILRVRFSDEYPIDSPEVTFLSTPPVHPHIYSNGHICLNILGEEWSPVLTVQSICLSIQSMLSSSPSKTPPHDDESYSRRVAKGSNPKKTRFVYHDDTV